MNILDEPTHCIFRADNFCILTQCNLMDWLPVSWGKQVLSSSRWNTSRLLHCDIWYMQDENVSIFRVEELFWMAVIWQVGYQHCTWDCCFHLDGQKTCGLSHHVVWYVATSVSEKTVTSVFNIDDFFWDMRSYNTVGLPTCWRKWLPWFLG